MYQVSKNRFFPNLCVFLSRTSFLFFIFLVLFWIEIKFIKFLAAQRAHFFDFFALLCRNIHFLLSNLAIFAKPEEILTKSTICGRKCRTFHQTFFDFLTSGNAFWAKVPMGKVVQNDSFYRFPNKFFGKKFWGNKLII